MVSAITSAANTAPSRDGRQVAEFHQVVSSVPTEACSTLEEAQRGPRAIYQQRIDLSKSSATCCFDLHGSLHGARRNRRKLPSRKNLQLRGYQAESSWSTQPCIPAHSIVLSTKLCLGPQQKNGRMASAHEPALPQCRTPHLLELGPQLQRP